MVMNSALIKVGSDPISSPTDNVRRAQICNTLFQYLADEVMGSSPWRFALRRTTLAPNSNTPPYGYQFSYDIPEDCLRLLYTPGEVFDWEVEDGGDWSDSETQILSNQSTLQMKYIFRNTDVSTWDARFCEALAWRLAMELALALTQSVELKQEAEKSYEKALAEARSMNAVIGKQPVLIADVWSLARKGYRYWNASAGQAGDDAAFTPANQNVP